MADITVTFGNGTSHVYTGVPDSATPDQVQARAAKDFPGTAVTHLDRKGGAATPASAPPAPPDASMSSPLSMIEHGGGEALLNMASGAVAKPVSDVMGLAATGSDMLTGNMDGDPGGFKQSIQDAMTYTPKTQAGKAAAQNNPLALLGQIINSGIAEPVGNAFAPAEGARDVSPLRAALPKGVTELVNQLPALLGGAAKAGAPQIGGALKGQARDLMQSALKPDLEARKSGNAAKAIDTLLDKGVNVSKGGVGKMQGWVDDLNTKIDALVKNSPVSVNRARVADISSTFDKFKKQVNSTSDLGALQRAVDDFNVSADRLAAPGGSKLTLPVEAAQEMKKGTYRQLERKKAYSGDDLKAADVAGQTALAHNLKEEIARAIPKVVPLNAEESKILNALSITEHRVLASANKNPAGLGLLTTNPAKFAAWMADRSDTFKSIVARMLNSGAENAQSLGRGAAATGALTSAAAAGAPQNNPMQAQ